MEILSWMLSYWWAIMGGIILASLLIYDLRQGRSQSEIVNRKQMQEQGRKDFTQIRGEEQGKQTKTKGSVSQYFQW